MGRRERPRDGRRVHLDCNPGQGKDLVERVWFDYFNKKNCTTLDHAFYLIRTLSHMLQMIAPGMKISPLGSRYRQSKS